MGIVICEATNEEGKTEARANVIVNDINGEFTIWNENGTPIVAGDDASIVCGASAFKYIEMNWYKDDALVTNTTSKSNVIEHLNKGTKSTVKNFDFRHSNGDQKYTVFPAKRDPLEVNWKRGGWSICLPCGNHR